jgi:hypothetical protein
MSDQKFFNIVQCRKLFKGEDGEEKNYKALQKYINSFIFPLDNGDFFLRKDSEYELMKRQTIINTYIVKIDKDALNWFNTKYDRIYRVICDVKKPKISGDDMNGFEFNTFGGFKYTTTKPYNSFSTEIKKACDLFKCYILEILADGRQDSYQYIIKWLANVCKGNKNSSALYLKGPEGIGKSTISEFMVKHVLGDKISQKADTRPLLSQFNIILAGKLFVYFEELPTFSSNEWAAVSSKFKDYITGDMMSYEAKCQNAFNAKNISNFIINSNHEAIQHADGRRYFCLDVSTTKKKDAEYFGKLYDACFNDNVGYAFWCYLHEIDLKDFKAQRDMPMTNNKKAAIADLLDVEYKFLKETFILKKVEPGLLKIDDLYTKYKKYCENKHKPLSNIKFYGKLKDIGIEHSRRATGNYYNISLVELNNIAAKNNWIHELDEYKPETFADEEDDDLISLQQQEEMNKIKEEEQKARTQALKKMITTQIKLYERIMQLEKEKRKKTDKQYESIIKNHFTSESGESDEEINIDLSDLVDEITLDILN